MQSNIMFILVAAEIALLCLAVCLFLVFKNRSLQRLIERLRKRMDELVDDLRKARANKNQENAVGPENSQETKSYIDWINDQLDRTNHFHNELNSAQNIALDISPDNPLANRTAALRHALFLAEKEAFAQNQADLPDWKILQQRYEKIFHFYEERSEDQENETNQVEIDALNEELGNARKRINNLEKFKKLYFELEDKWQNCKDEAQMHFSSLTRMANQVENPQEFEQTLESYHAAYNQVSSLIESGFEASLQAQSTGQHTNNNNEIRRLKQIAAEQHKVIGDLQQKLRESNSSEEVQTIVSSLEVELQKQIRFASESETCVQLMEDELQTAHTELDILRSKVNTLPQLKTQLMELRKDRDEFEAKTNALSNENHKLRKKIKESDSSKDDAIETIKLRKALTSMEAKYNDLEEKFLDLKLQKNG